MWTNTFLFLLYLAIRWRLVTSGVENEGGVSAIRAFVVSLGGHRLLLCFWCSLREVVLSWFAGQWGRLQPRFPVELRRRRYVKDLKLIWFGDFKI
jgi:hypothetical protein